jgi:hypothetical protein
MGERYYREEMKPRKKVMPLPSQNFGAVGRMLRDNGFVPMPLDGKRPIPKNWSGFWYSPPSDAAYNNWIKNNTTANVGICTGEVIALDIDLDDQDAADAAQAAIFSTLGETRFIRLGRVPRRQLFYRLSYEEARQASSWQLGKIELLANGRQSAAFGIHPDTGIPFTWPDQSILGVSSKSLPLVTIDQLCQLRKSLSSNAAEEEAPAKHSFTPDYSPQLGERDKYLFWYAKEQAASADTFEILFDRVLQRNRLFDNPLSLTEAKAKAKSAWGLKIKGKLFLQGASAPTIIPAPRAMIAGLVRELDPQAAKLLIGLSVNRYSADTFTIPQQATADAFGMSKGALFKGLKQLIRLGIVVDTGRTKRVSLQFRPAKLYRFGVPAETDGHRRMLDTL